MNQTRIQEIAFVFLLVSLPVITVGTNQGIVVLWAFGLGLLLVGGLAPPALRFASGEDEEEEVQEEEQDREKGSDDEES